MFILLVLLFIIFCGNFTCEILIFGIGISLCVCFFAYRYMGYSFRKEFKLLRKLPYILAYIPVLVFEIIKANICTSGLVFKGNKNIEPVLVSFDSPLKTEIASVILANSITLTPGTISVSMRNGRFKVHCLDRSLCDGIDSSSFVKLLKKIEE